MTLAPTPRPSEAANAMAAKPSRADLRNSWSRAVAQTVVEGAEHGQRPDAEHQGAGDEALDEALTLGALLTSAGPGVQGDLQPAAEPLEALLDAEDRARDPAQDQGAQHDQHRGAVADGPRPGVVADARRGGGRDEQRDQAEPVGDDIAGALRQPVPDQDAEDGPDQDRHDVHEGADSGEQPLSSQAF
jgi:hypothetical protein